MACRPRSRITKIVVGLIILTFGVSTNQGVAPIRKADTALAASAFYILCSSIYPHCTHNYTIVFPLHIPIRSHTILIVCSHTSPASDRACSLSGFTPSEVSSEGSVQVPPVHYLGDGGIRQSGATPITESSEESVWTPRSFTTD